MSHMLFAMNEKLDSDWSVSQSYIYNSETRNLCLEFLQ